MVRPQIFKRHTAPDRKMWSYYTEKNSRNIRSFAILEIFSWVNKCSCDLKIKREPKRHCKSWTIKFLQETHTHTHRTTIYCIRSNLNSTRSFLRFLGKIWYQTPFKKYKILTISLRVKTHYTRNTVSPLLITLLLYIILIHWHRYIHKGKLYFSTNFTFWILFPQLVLSFLAPDQIQGLGLEIWNP